MLSLFSYVWPIWPDSKGIPECVLSVDKCRRSGSSGMPTFGTWTKILTASWLKGTTSWWSVSTSQIDITRRFLCRNMPGEALKHVCARPLLKQTPDYCWILIEFIHSFIPSFVRSFVRSFVHSFIHSFIHSSITNKYFVEPNYTHHTSLPRPNQPTNRRCNRLITTLALLLLLSDLEIVWMPKRSASYLLTYIKSYQTNSNPVARSGCSRWRFLEMPWQRSMINDPSFRLYLRRWSTLLSWSFPFQQCTRPDCTSIRTCLELRYSRIILKFPKVTLIPVRCLPDMPKAFQPNYAAIGNMLWFVLMRRASAETTLIKRLVTNKVDDAIGPCMTLSLSDRNLKKDTIEKNTSEHLPCANFRLNAALKKHHVMFSGQQFVRRLLWSCDQIFDQWSMDFGRTPTDFQVICSWQF